MSVEQARGVLQSALRVPGFRPSLHGRVPPLWRVNGIGFKLLGYVPRSSGTMIKVLWFTIFFIPIVPLRAYEVVPVAGGYRFVADGGFLSLARHLRFKTIALMLAAYVEGALAIALLVAVFLGIGWIRSAVG